MKILSNYYTPVHYYFPLTLIYRTGDITFRYLQYLENESKHSPPAKAIDETNEEKAKVTVLDLTQAMLDVGMARAKINGFEKGSIEAISWLLLVCFLISCWSSFEFLPLFKTYSEVN